MCGHYAHVARRCKRAARIKRGFEVVLGRQAVGLDPANAALALDDGATLAFDRVALATGSRPLLPPVEGLDKPGVVAFRGPEDCDEIRAAVAGFRAAL